MGTAPSSIDEQAVTLKNGERLPADLVVIGAGVRPRVQLAEDAGLAVDNGIQVDEFLQTSAPGIWAAGDVARYPDPRAGKPIRVEHWVVAERQGQAAAKNILGLREPFRAVPFFWSQHYDVTIAYVGHAEEWDRIEIDGSIAGHDCVLRYSKDGKLLAVLSIFRDVESLRAEVAMEREAGA
jgi:NADPH-dependent 2,4-dienoyl-CoA reductase/sulfur reductase-like enzyme